MANEYRHLNLLICGPDPTIACACSELASLMGLKVKQVPDLPTVRSWLRPNTINLLLTNLGYENETDLDFVTEVNMSNPDMAHIVMASTASVRALVEAMRSGACDYLPIPFTVDEFTSVIDRAVETYRSRIEHHHLRGPLKLPDNAGRLIVRSSGMEKILRMIPKVALSMHPVLILGESGTGKEVVAKVIHESGPNAQRPFVPVDCASLSPTLIESELFGHTKGAFTGATSAKDGLLLSAKDGTVFLDEIGELPIELQPKLLRAIQEKEVRPLGSNRVQLFEGRVLAATNRDLVAMVSAGTFRKDLYYRLNVVSLRIPPLRDRKEDIPIMAAHFLDRNSQHRACCERFKFSDKFLNAIMQHDWPGNVRELENVIDRACALADGDELSIGVLPTVIREAKLSPRLARNHSCPKRANPAPTRIVPVAELERRAILDAVASLDGDRLAAAKMLGIGKTTLYRKLKEYESIRSNSIVEQRGSCGAQQGRIQPIASLS